MKFQKFVKIRKEKFGAVVFDTLREKVFVANQWGAAILKFLEDGEPLENIPPLLAHRYAGNLPGIEKDADDFVKELVERDLLIK